MLWTLKNCSLFEGLSEDILTKIASFSEEVNFQAGETIFFEGDVTQKLYVVKEGKVAREAKLSTRPGSTRRGTIETISSGEAFGLSAIYRTRHVMSARAIAETKAIAIDGQALESLLLKDPQTSSTIMRKLGESFYRQFTDARTMLARFLSIASHDLKSPLAAVQSYLNVILGGFVGELNEKQKEMLSRSSARITEFIEMINNILELSQFEAGQMEMTPLSLPKVVSDAAETLRPMAEEKGLNLSLDLFQEVPQIKGSGIRLKQVITNLVGNAIKFTPSGEISVRIKEQDNSLAVEVADTGIGISNEDLPKIFDDFYHGLAGDTGVKGAGLGLSICKKIVEAHSGKIWAESPCPETGKGSKFTFTLPKS